MVCVSDSQSAKLKHTAVLTPHSQDAKLPEVLTSGTRTEKTAADAFAEPPHLNARCVLRGFCPQISLVMAKHLSMYIDWDQGQQGASLQEQSWGSCSAVPLPSRSP